MGAYLNAHLNHMDRLLKTRVVARDELEIIQRGDGYVIAGEVHIEGGAVVRVHKEVRVVRKTGKTTYVQTKVYSYNVSIPGAGSVIRHDGPDDHRPYHHVHRYRPLDGDREGTLERVDLDDVPTLAEVLTDAYGWCMTHREAIDALQGEP